jgi:hypothetical protein
LRHGVYYLWPELAKVTAREPSPGSYVAVPDAVPELEPSITQLNIGHGKISSYGSLGAPRSIHEIQYSKAILINFQKFYNFSRRQMAMKTTRNNGQRKQMRNQGGTALRWAAEQQQ